MENKEISVINRSGIATIDNYNEIKKWLQDGVIEYEGKTYSTPAEAESDRVVLESIKSKIKSVQDEIKKPYADIEKQLDNLIKIIQKPIKAINDYEKELKNNEKKRQIVEYALTKAQSLGSYGTKVVESKAFFNEDWLKSTYTDKKWRDEIDKLIFSVANDIDSIQKSSPDNAATLTAMYIETLSMDSVKNFIANAESEVEKINAGEDEDKVIGYKIIRISGTATQLSQLYDQIEIMGLEFEEIEDGMPKDLEELTTPDFDSFVAFDIEHSGTYGASNGDAPPEITEIGAVKVVDGKIVDTFSMLANPGRPITKQNERLTHITNEMVRNEPPVSEVIKLFKEFCGDMVLVGHNIKSVDIPFVVRAGRKNGIAYQNKFFDTYTYAKKFKDVNNWDNVKLEYLAGQFGIEDNSHHRAYNDAEVNVDVFFKLKQF